jgi:transposase
MTIEVQYIEKIADLEQENKKLLESKLYYKNYSDQLHQIIQDFRRHRFGKRSEAYHHPDQQQFDFLEAIEPAKVAETEIVTIEKYTRKKNKKKKPRLPTKVVIIEADKQCTCGHDKEVIRYDVSKRINFQPEVYEIIEERREVVACKQHCEGSTKTARAPKRFLSKTGVTESFLANIIVSKFDDRQPLYHQEKRLKSRFGILLSRQNMARWIISSAAQLMPLYNLMMDSLTNYDVASMDATTIQVLDEPDRNPSTKSYMYCFRGGEHDKVILYDYNDTDHQTFVLNWFEGFSGTIHSDADSFFNKLYQQENVHSALCNAHARRKFESIAKTSKKALLAHHAMQVYRKLYAIEKKAKDEKLSPDEIKQLRQKHTKPLLKAFKTWLENKIGLVPQQSPIFKAMRYTLKNWDGLVRYLDDGRFSIDNNHTEREIKPFVIARKNFMFSKSQAGARAMAIHFSLIRTATLHGLDPYRYYVHIMEQIPHSETVEDYEKLLPWNTDLSTAIVPS